MSESENTGDTQAPVAPTPAAPVTAGGLLKAARQAAGVHMAVLSVNLKVPVRQLEALEANQFPADQSPVFVRALACSVCRQLRVDPAPILALMPLTSNYLEPHGAVRYANSPPANLGRIDEGASPWPFKTIGAALALLIVIVALVWMPQFSQWPFVQALLAKGSSNTTEATALVAPAVPEAVPTGAVAAVTQQPPSPSPGVAGAPSGNAASGQPSELSLTALGTSWVEVRDGKNQVLWTGVLKPGESNRVPVLESATVTIGRAEAIQAVFKGQTVDLRVHTKDNVARFEVNP